MQSGLSLGDPASYLDSNNTNALKVFITNVLSHLAPGLNETVVQEAVAGIVDLEAHLAEVLESILVVVCKILTLLWNFPIILLLSLQVFEDVSNFTQNITKNYKLRDLGNLSKLWPAVSVTNKNDVAVCSTLHPYGGKLRVFFQISYSLIGSTSQMLCLEQSMSL